jgi:hypothetical protein
MPAPGISSFSIKLWRDIKQPTTTVDQYVQADVLGPQFSGGFLDGCFIFVVDLHNLRPSCLELWPVS